MRLAEIHSHSDYSNIKNPDSINRVRNMVQYCQEIGLTGLCLTDHETLSGHGELFKEYKKLRKENKDFTIGFGNEIYLIDKNEGRKQKYYHFILIAKDYIGLQAIRELSSRAWLQSYTERGQERTPTYYTDVKEIIEKYGKGHIIASSACLGSFIGEFIREKTEFHRADLGDYIRFGQDNFGDDFYLEVQSSISEDQCKYNQLICTLSNAYHVKLVVSSDAHYKTKEERLIHKAFLQSKHAEREVDSFYEYTYFKTVEETNDLLIKSGMTVQQAKEAIDSTQEIINKIEYFDLERSPIIPKEPLPPAKKYENKESEHLKQYPNIYKLITSDIEEEVYYIGEILDKLYQLKLYNDKYLKRIDEEVEVISWMSEQFNDCMFAYFTTLRQYIDLFWECGSTVGTGRGSAGAFLTNYLLGLTEVDPIEHNLWKDRFANKERASIFDIDIDLAPSKRPLIFEKIREKRGQLGLVQVATFGTAGTKEAIRIAMRGLGYDIDTALYMTSLVPSERGFNHSINDLFFGNEEKGIKPNAMFIKESALYPNFKETVLALEGLITRRGTHASGVILYDEKDIYKQGSVMKTTGGDIITSFDLHTCEDFGDIKYDFLVTEVQDKITECIKLLQEYGHIEEGSVRDIYRKYLHPTKLVYGRDHEIWKHLWNNDYIDIFQFNEASGINVAKQLQPASVREMSLANSIMRLMTEQGEESQIDKYKRIKANPEEFESDMKMFGLSTEQKAKMHYYLDDSYGTCPEQETIMLMLMEPCFTGFSLSQADKARKIIAKKQMDKIGALKNRIRKEFDDQLQFEFFYKTVVQPSLGYGFNSVHSLCYSFIGLQTLTLASQWPSIYWSTACLKVNSGSLDYASDKGADYNKLGRALGNVKQAGVNIELPDINKSSLGFIPDEENNQILFGMKGIPFVSNSSIEALISKRPYSSLADFREKNPEFNKRQMVFLIKSGSFDKFGDRMKLMEEYISSISRTKDKLTIANLPKMVENNIIPLEKLNTFEYKVFEFNRYLKKTCKDGTNFKMDDRAIDFVVNNWEELVEIPRNNNPRKKIIQTFTQENIINIECKKWDNLYQLHMTVLKNYLKENEDELLSNFNKVIIDDEMEVFKNASLSKWEMESLGIYYHEHELAGIDLSHYGIVRFCDLPDEPEVARWWPKNGIKLPIYKLEKIAGTVLAADSIKSTVVLQTVDSVVNLKLRKEPFALYNKQLSELGEDGKKHVVEKGWFQRGNIIIAQGIKKGPDFIAKKYNNSKMPHMVYKINSFNAAGELEIQKERKGGNIV